MAAVSRSPLIHGRRSSRASLVECTRRAAERAHDIGGFRGDPNPELTVRWTQFGALS
ncbi:TIM-barrel domain-containing protein, partial [Alistipes onderdonkii]|uniref:TIM-barrel domain-containing protein n=1 Tax=Alistipes onderdonkii TaxID=328813 RepID=UPI0034E3F23C